MDANADLAKLALDYHAYPTPGKSRWSLPRP